MGKRGPGPIAAWLLTALVLASCAAPAEPPSSSDAEVGALQTQVAALSAQVESLQATAGALPPTVPPPGTVGASLSDGPTAGAGMSRTEEIEPAATATPEPPEATATTGRPSTRTPPPLTEADAAPCGVGQIKANERSGIYHAPGGGSYARTRANVVCFDTDTQAEAAGYRKALN